MSCNSSHAEGCYTPRQAVLDVLHRRRPQRFVYAPNYWQWFSHHRQHGSLPAELSNCPSQLAMIRQLGLDVLSRNIYADQHRCWFGGLSDIIWSGVDFEQSENKIGGDLLIERTFHTPHGPLFERQRYCADQSTLVQEKYLVDDYTRQLDAYEAIIRARRWRFNAVKYQQEQTAVGQDGIVMVGELFSPLKMLHLELGPNNTTFLLMDHPDRIGALLKVHEESQLDLVRQIASAGVDAMIAMDNLDATFHSPVYLDKYSASFYERASCIAHQFNSTFFIHACGQQRAILKRIASLGVDGLEGVAFPPLGDIALDEAMKMTGDDFIITGGISAMEFNSLLSQEAVSRYLRQLLDRIAPYSHRFILAASCSTPITARWEQLKWLADAWRGYVKTTDYLAP